LNAWRLIMTSATAATEPDRPVPAKLEFELETTAVICVEPAEPNWLWHGYLAAGNYTLLTSQWKCGKTSLLSVLLARMGSGGTLAGRAVRPGRAVVVSEEPRGLWAARIRKLNIGPHVRFLCRPFRGRRPTPEEWQALINFLARCHREEELALVVIDSLATFVPGRSENDALAIIDILLPLEQLLAAGVAVLLNHHPRKGVVMTGQAARGSGALGGNADIVIEMDGLSGPVEDDRRRKLATISRHDATQRRLVIELSSDGTDYHALGDFNSPELDDGWQVMFWVLEDADRKLTRKELLAAWPADYHRPDSTALWRWLDRAVKEGRVLQEGTGRSRNPFRYWLPASEERWAKDPNRLDDLDPLPELGPPRHLLGFGPTAPARPRREKKGGAS
jgi:AAA domain